MPPESEELPPTKAILVDDKDSGAGLTGRKCCGKPGKPGTHDNDVVHFVKLGFTGSVCCGDGRNSCRQGNSLNQTAAGEFCHG